MPRPTNFGAILAEVLDLLTPEQIATIEQEIADAQAEREALFVSTGTLEGAVNDTAINAMALNGDSLPTVPTLSRDVSVNVYADGVLRATVSRVNRMARLPSGFKAQKWEIEVTGDMPVEQVTLATSGAELMGV